MSWPSYPDRKYIKRPKFGLYLDPDERARSWGLRVHGLGNFTSKVKDIPPRGRVLNEYALLIVQEGEGTLKESNGEESALSAGDVVLVAPDWWHLYNPHSGKGWRTAWVIFDGPVADNLFSEGFFTAGRLAKRIELAGLKYLVATIDGMIDRAMNFPESQGLHSRLSAELYGVLARLMDWTEFSHGDQRIEASIREVEKSFVEEINFKELQRSSGMGVTPFLREFRRVTGNSPKSYQQRLKVRLAKELLSHTDDPVSEIARKVGYHQSAYFSRIFSAKVGMSPIAWRMSTK